MRAARTYVSEAFSATITCDRFAFQQATGSGAAVFSSATSGNVAGRKKRIFIPANTFTSVVFTTGGDLGGIYQRGDAFISDQPYLISAWWQNGRMLATTTVPVL